MTLAYWWIRVPVISRRGARRRNQHQKPKVKLSFEQKLAKLGIADFWHKDSDGTKYYVNVAVFGDDEERVMVRFRIDIPGDEPLILALDTKTAMMLGIALQRAAFAAQVLTADEVRRLWQIAKGWTEKHEGSENDDESNDNVGGRADGVSEEAEEDIPIPDSFA